MVAWEYMIIRADADNRTVALKKDEIVPLRDFLSNVGSRGWELIAVGPTLELDWDGVSVTTGNYHLLYLKRKVE